MKEKYCAFCRAFWLRIWFAYPPVLLRRPGVRWNKYDTEITPTQLLVEVQCVAVDLFERHDKYMKGWFSFCQKKDKRFQFLSFVAVFVICTNNNKYFIQPKYDKKNLNLFKKAWNKIIQKRRWKTYSTHPHQTIILTVYLVVYEYIEIKTKKSLILFVHLLSWLCIVLINKFLERVNQTHKN